MHLYYELMIPLKFLILIVLFLVVIIARDHLGPTVAFALLLLLVLFVALLMWGAKRVVTAPLATRWIIFLEETLRHGSTNNLTLQ